MVIFHYRITEDQRKELLEKQARENDFHKFVEGNLILKQGLVDKRKVSFPKLFLLSFSLKTFPMTIHHPMHTSDNLLFVCIHADVCMYEVCGQREQTHLFVYEVHRHAYVMNVRHTGIKTCMYV